MTTARMLCLLAALLAACRNPDPEPAPAGGAPGSIGFDQAAAGSLPAGWRTGATRAAEMTATWNVRKDPRALSAPNVLSLTETGHDSQDTYNLCWSDELQFSDGALEVSVRADAGEVDQGGGPIWRVRDANNYYVCRFNPLEANFRVYVVKDGVRRQLATAIADCGEGEWHRVRVEHTGSRIACWLDGAKLLEAEDATLAGGGGVGFWTKADALTSFDDLRLQ